MHDSTFIRELIRCLLCHILQSKVPFNICVRSEVSLKTFASDLNVEEHCYIEHGNVHFCLSAPVIVWVRSTAISSIFMIGTSPSSWFFSHLIRGSVKRSSRRRWRMSVKVKSWVKWQSSILYHSAFFWLMIKHLLDHYISCPTVWQLWHACLIWHGISLFLSLTSRLLCGQLPNAVRLPSRCFLGDSIAMHDASLTLGF